MVVHLYDDISAPTAVTAVRAAGGNVFFPVEGNRPVASVPDFTVMRAVSINAGMVTPHESKSPEREVRGS
jgi:hypothetical protein